MQIQLSIDWQEVRRRLKIEMTSFGYNPDLDKMMTNIDKMVSELSQLEVVVRRTHKTLLYNEKLVIVNAAIDRLEKLILMAKLMR